jgi:hypothetical protein
MQEISKEQKGKIINALTERGAVLPCPRCGNKNFTLLDGYINSLVQPEVTSGIILGGPTVPTVGVVCSRCGYLCQHAIGALGLLPKTENTNQEAINTEESKEEEVKSECK